MARNITNTKLEEMVIDLPPLPEQRRIAAILARADGARARRREANALAGQVAQSVSLEMFGDPVMNEKGWPLARCGDVFEVKLGKMLWTDKITGKCLRPYLRNTNVQWHSFDLRDVKEMDFSPVEVTKFELRKGDILVCEGGEVGRAAIWNEAIPGCCSQKALHRLRPLSNSIQPLYFTMLMQLAASGGLLTRETTSVTIALLTAEKLRELLLPLPPASLQWKYANLVVDINASVARQVIAMHATEHIFHTLLHSAFDGQLASKHSC